jgi:hypothetical protein
MTVLLEDSSLCSSFFRSSTSSLSSLYAHEGSGDWNIARSLVLEILSIPNSIHVLSAEEQPIRPSPFPRKDEMIRAYYQQSRVVNSPLIIESLWSPPGFIITHQSQ